MDSRTLEAIRQLKDAGLLKGEPSVPLVPEFFNAVLDLLTIANGDDRAMRLGVMPEHYPDVQRLDAIRTVLDGIEGVTAESIVVDLAAYALAQPLEVLAKSATEP